MLKFICFFCQDNDAENEDVLPPKPATLLADLNERFVQISPTSAYNWNNAEQPHHTVALAESGIVYAFGGGSMGQLGVKLVEGKEAMPTPVQVAIDNVKSTPASA